MEARPPPGRVQVVCTDCTALRSVQSVATPHADRERAFAVRISTASSARLYRPHFARFAPCRPGAMLAFGHANVTRGDVEHLEPEWAVAAASAGHSCGSCRDRPRPDRPAGGI